jgi:glycosyltransferase involved in cell wall biosynthesis
VEPHGLIIVEAMPTETPVVAHAAAGSAEVLKEPVTESLASDSIVKAFRHAIRRAINARYNPDAVGAAGRARALDQFTSQGHQRQCPRDV